MNLNIFVACVHNMPLCEDFSSTHGKIKGKASMLMGGIKVGDERKRQGKQQIKGNLTTNMWILICSVVACLPDLVSTEQNLPIAGLSSLAPAQQPFVISEA